MNIKEMKKGLSSMLMMPGVNEETTVFADVLFGGNDVGCATTIFIETNCAGSDDDTEMKIEVCLDGMEYEPFHDAKRKLKNATNALYDTAKRLEHIINNAPKNTSTDLHNEIMSEVDSLMAYAKENEAE